MARTAQQMLDAVDLAIQKIEEGAQTVSVNGHSYTRGNLDALYAERRRLERRVARNGRIRVRGVTPYV